MKQVVSNKCSDSSQFIGMQLTKLYKFSMVSHKLSSAETQINRVMSHKVSLWSMFLFEGEKSILHKETVFSWPHVTKPSDAKMKRQWGKTHLNLWYLSSLYQDNKPVWTKKNKMYSICHFYLSRVQWTASKKNSEIYFAANRKLHSAFSLGCCDITSSIHSRNVPIDLGRFLYIDIIKPTSTRLGQHTWVTRISLCMYLAI